MVSALSELYDYRALLRNFLVRDLNSRYKGSVLGVVWSLLNPLLMMAVYTIVFSKVLRFSVSGESYPVFFLAGYLPWTFFASTLQMGATTLVGNAGLIQKVYFPREVLPLSMTVANLVNLGIGIALLVPYAAWEVGVDVVALLGLIPVTLGLLGFAAGFALLFAALMVYFRDVEFLLGIFLTAW